jgi:hypothetical protein
MLSCVMGNGFCTVNASAQSLLSRKVENGVVKDSPTTRVPRVSDPAETLDRQASSCRLWGDRGSWKWPETAPQPPLCLRPFIPLSLWARILHPELEKPNYKRGG